MLVRRARISVSVLVAIMVAVVAPADARSPDDERSGIETALPVEKPKTVVGLGVGVGDSFFGLDKDGRVSNDSKPRIEEGVAEIYVQRVMSREPGAVYLDLLKARDAGERLVISPMDSVDLVLVPVRSEDHALPQETLLFVLESSGEYVIFGGGKDSVFGSIPDPERRGVWAFVPNEDRQLEVTLSRSLEEFGDDVAEDKPYEYDESLERFADPFADEAEMVAPDGVDEGWEKLSSVPDETWVYSNGERVIDRLGMPNESREARIVTSPGNTPVIDVAFMAAEYSPQAYELGEVAQIIINDVNLTMINTGIDTRFRLVGLDRNSRDFG